jgi:hypothetical protein
MQSTLTWKIIINMVYDQIAKEAGEHLSSFRASWVISRKLGGCGQKCNRHGI